MYRTQQHMYVCMWVDIGSCHLDWVLAHYNLATLTMDEITKHVGSQNFEICFKILKCLGLKIEDWRFIEGRLPATFKPSANPFQISIHAAYSPVGYTCECIIRWGFEDCWQPTFDNSSIFNLQTRQFQNFEMVSKFWDI